MSDNMVKQVAEAIWADACPGMVWSLPDELHYIMMARAAIAAMREPTSAMVIAGLECAHVDLASEWRAMIDKALNLRNADSLTEVLPNH